MKEKNILIKLFLCSVYLIIITILIVGSYHMFKDKQKEVYFSDSESVSDYSYINIYKMSEKFAYYKESNIGIHFVIDKEETGVWHTYIIAIDEKDYDKYKDIIDYSYNRIQKEPKPIKVYGYPVIVSKKLKELTISNIDKFIPKDNEVKITKDNYEEYLTNSYLDTTVEKKDTFNIALCASLIAVVLLIVLFFITLFDKGKKTTN